VLLFVAADLFGTVAGVGLAFYSLEFADGLTAVGLFRYALPSPFFMSIF
jgi:hypothetical protein